MFSTAIYSSQDTEANQVLITNNWIKKMPHSSALAWKIPWTEEPGGLQSMGSLRVGHNWATSLSLSCIGEGNGNPLQCSCLENPRDGESGGLPSKGSHRVGHDWSDLAVAGVYIHIHIYIILLYKYTMEYYPAIKIMNTAICTTWTDL